MRIWLTALLLMCAATVSAQTCPPNPTITVERFSNALKTGESGTASVLLTVPSGHKVVSVTARLVPSTGPAIEQLTSIDATNGNAIAGIRYMSLSPGKFGLYLRVTDDKGCSDSTALKREVVVTGKDLTPPPVVEPPPVITPPPVIEPPPVVQVPGDLPHGAPCPDPADNSPTGRNPVLGWNCGLAHSWRLALALSKTDLPYTTTPVDPMMASAMFIKGAMDTFNTWGTSGSQGDAWLYQMTGDRKYAQQAYATMYEEFLQCGPPHGFTEFGGIRGSHTGAHGLACDGTYFVTQRVDLIMTMDQIWSGTDDQQHVVMMSSQDDLWLYFGAASFRTNDSDTSMGAYLGMTLAYELLKGIDPQIVAAKNHYVCAGETGPCTVGGLDPDPTVGRLDSLRNMVQYYFTTMAKGGEWFESHTEYNMTTLRFILEGYAGLETIAPGHFPEITAWLKDAARTNIYLAKPDLSGFIPWGDNELTPLGKWTVNTIWWSQIVDGLFEGLTKDPVVQGFTLDLMDKFKQESTGRVCCYVNHDGQVLPPGASWFDGTVPRGDWRSLPKGQFYAGVGMSAFHDGWNPTDSLFVTHCPQWGGSNIQHFNQPYTDHTPGWCGDVELWRHGGMVLGHPYSYDSAPTYSGHGVNGFDVYRAYASAQEFKSIVAHEFAPTFVYQAATTGGQTNGGEGQGYGGQTFFQEWTRSIVYSGTRSKLADSILITDRSYVTPLSTTQDAWTCVQCTGTPRPKRQLTFHMPVVPTIAGTVNWVAENSDQVTINTVFPAAATRILFDESIIYNCGDPCGVDDPSERKWQVRIGSQADPDFECFLNVITAGTLSHHETALSGDGIEGVVLHRDGEADAAFVANCRLDDARPLAEPVVDGGGKATYMAANQSRLQTVHLFNHPVHVSIPMDVAGQITVLDLPQTWTVSLDGVNQGAPDDQGVKTLDVVVGPHILDADGPVIVPILSGMVSHAQDFSGTLSSLPMPHTIAPNDNRALTLGVWGSATDTLQGCMFGSQTFTKLGSVLPSGDRLLYGLFLPAPAVGTADIRCTFTAPGLIAMVAGDYAGVSQAVPVALPTTEQQGSHVSFSVTTTTSQPGSWLVSFIRNDALPISAYRNTRVRYDDIAFGMFDSAGSYATPGAYTMGVQAGDRPQTQWGALTFALAPAEVK